MKSEVANKRLADLIVKASKEFDSDAIASELMSIREIAKEEKDPSVTKILRLASEYIESNGTFEIGYVESEEDEVVEMTDFEYLMELLIHSDREANREEIRGIRDLLIAELY